MIGKGENIKKLKFVVAAILILTFAISAFLASGYNEQRKLRKKPLFVKHIYSMGDEHFKKPLALTAGNGSIFVADNDKGYIYIFTDSGDYTSRFKAIIPGEKTSSFASALTLNDAGQLLVADSANSRILVFNAQGRYLFTLTNKIKKPLGIASFNNEIYVTDISDHTVKVFSNSGKKVRSFGGGGTIEGKFQYPNGIDVSRNGDVVVADSNNKRIQVFDSSGKFNFSFGSDFLALPKGVAVDSKGNIHVADTLGLRARVFSPEGELLHSYNNENKQTSFYQGIAIGEPSGQLYLTDRLNNIIEIWKLYR